MKRNERIKSFLLAFLVLTSVYLVQELWIDFPGKFLSSFSFGQESINVKEGEVPDFLLPEEYILNFGGKNRAILYSDEAYDLWSKGKEILKVIYQSKNLTIEAIDNNQYEEINKRKSINFYFPNETYTFMFGKMFRTDISSVMNDSIKKINSIYISLDSKQDTFVVLSNEENHLKISGVYFDVEDIKTQVDSISQTNYTRIYTVAELLGSNNNDIYMPLEVNFNLSQVYVRKEIEMNDDVSADNIARLFFDRDLAYIRRIEENDGSLIYIDSQRTLKIQENGTLESFKAVEEISGDRNLFLSMENAIDYISTHMGWPDDTYLFKVEDIEFENNKGYRFTFRYKMDGLTVISDESKVFNGIEIEIFNDQIKTYKRRVWEQIGKVRLKSSYKNMLSAYNILDKNFSFIKTRYVEDKNLNIDEIDDEDLDLIVKSSINDVYLAYYDNSLEGNQVLKPVWVIDIAGFSYIFDAYDGYVENGGDPKQ